MGNEQTDFITMFMNFLKKLKTSDDMKVEDVKYIKNEDNKEGCNLIGGESNQKNKTSTVYKPKPPENKTLNEDTRTADKPVENTKTVDWKKSIEDKKTVDKESTKTVTEYKKMPVTVFVTETEYITNTNQTEYSNKEKPLQNVSPTVNLDDNYNQTSTQYYNKGQQTQPKQNNINKDNKKEYKKNDNINKDNKEEIEKNDNINKDNKEEIKKNDNINKDNNESMNKKNTHELNINIGGLSNESNKDSGEISEIIIKTNKNDNKKDTKKKKINKKESKKESDNNLNTKNTTQRTLEDLVNEISKNKNSEEIQPQRKSKNKKKEDESINNNEKLLSELFEMFNVKTEDLDNNSKKILLTLNNNTKTETNSETLSSFLTDLTQDKSNSNEEVLTKTADLSSNTLLII